MLARYEGLLRSNPIAVKSCIGCAIAFSGDATAQAIEHRRAHPDAGAGAAAYDAKRGLALTTLGTLWNGPFLHFYFGALERNFPQRAGRQLRSLLAKTTINQLIVNPLVYLPLFYVWTGTVMGRTAEATAEKARKEYKSSLVATWSIFTPVNLVNFYFTPVRYQAFVNQVVSYIYNTTLSLIAAPRRTDLTMSTNERF